MSIGGIEGRRTPNVFKFARKLVKRQPCWKKERERERERESAIEFSVTFFL